jgi:antitoxin ParD1/3/4
MINVDLDAHWSGFVNRKIADGSFRTADEVVIEALRMLHVRDQKLAALRAHLEEGMREADAGLFVEDFSIERLIEELEAELDT